MTSVQVIILGQGFAGTALAWSLAMRGIPFVVIDDEKSNTSSRIAAGLVTPITGKRAVKTWEWEAAWRQAQHFYSEIEMRTKSVFWHVQPSLRLHDSAAEKALVESRWSDHPELVTLCPPEDADAQGFDQAYGGILMKNAARLDGLTYLRVSRNAFTQSNAFHHRWLDLKNDIELDKDSIRIPDLGLEAQAIVCCQGYSPGSQPWFSNLPLVPSQGDILTVDIPHFGETRTLHRNLWITPLCNESTRVPSSRYLVGSTYRWQPLDGLPSEEARIEITMKLSKWLKRSYEVVDHRSAVRPTSFDHKPLLGQSSIDPRIWVFNGLGAKGTLMAPWCAEQLVHCLVDGRSLSSSLLWNRRRS